MSKVSVKYGSSSEGKKFINFIIPTVSLTCGTSSSYDIQYNSSAISTLHRINAKRNGKICVISFVATINSMSSGTTLFTIATQYLPDSQVDFLMLHSSSGVVNGMFDTSGIVSSNVALSSGTIRAELVWVVS